MVILQKYALSVYSLELHPNVLPVTDPVDVIVNIDCSSFHDYLSVIL